MTRASFADFLPDEALAFRSIGSPAVTETTESTPISLAKLQAYWTTDEWGIADKLLIMVKVDDIFVDTDETYVFSLEVASDLAFTSPTTVASLPVDGTNVGDFFLMSVDPEDMIEFDSTANYIRLVATLDGTDPSLEYIAYVKTA